MSAVTHMAPVTGGASLLVAWRAAEQNVLVIGGGAVAAGRVRLALEADAKVTVVAPELSAELKIRADRNEIIWHPRTFVESDLDHAHMVMSAIDDPEVSHTIFELCRAKKIPVNVADVPHACDFWFTSIHRRGPLQVAISSNGHGPSISSRLAKEIAQQLPEDVEAAIDAFGALRRAIRSADPGPESSSRRMTWLAEVGRTWSYEDLAAMDDEHIVQLVEDYRRGTPARPRRTEPEVATVTHLADHQAKVGQVHLVGAGPGDPGLLTVSAREALEQADIVFADRLIPQAILNLVQGELRFARKLPGRANEAQAELHAWVVEAARAGKDVVRLKAGDPFVYGRGGEELLHFAEHGIEAEVIPGLSSALTGPLLGGMPPTHRGLANRLVVLTGRTADGGWPEIPEFDENTTLVFLMAVGRAEALSQKLIARGYPESWPAAVVERAAQPEERRLYTHLAELGPEVVHQAIRSPAIIVVGRVTQFPAQLAEIAQGARSNSKPAVHIASGGDA